LKSRFILLPNGSIHAFKTLQHLHSHKYSLFLYKHNDSHSYLDNNFDLVIIITSQLLFFRFVYKLIILFTKPIIILITKQL